jgi:hypothetical protein
MFAVVRPSSWNPLLFFHIAGAMALVATLVVAIYALRLATARGDEPATKFAFRSLWMGVLPSYIVMRVFAQLIVDKEYPGTTPAPSWVGIGFGLADSGPVLLLVTLLLTGFALRTARDGTPVAGSIRLRAATILMGLLLAAYVVAIWAMTAKPS